MRTRSECDSGARLAREDAVRALGVRFSGSIPSTAGIVGSIPSPYNGLDRRLDSYLRNGTGKTDLK